LVAALFVEKNGVYYGLPDVDPWDEERDARKYAGPWPVVAHPPCSSWCQLASVNEARWGKRIGDDGGCFAAALKAVRTFGGVLEHPAYSLAWKEFELPRPARYGWTSKFGDEGWSTELSQSAYGHAARKRTWLYAVGVDFRRGPVLRWWEDHGRGVVGAGVHSGESAGRLRVEGYEARATPLAFRDALLNMARSALHTNPHNHAPEGADQIRTGEQIRRGPYTYDGQTELLYFAQADDGPVKIGISSKPEKRLNELQVCNAHEVTLLGVFEVPRGHEKFLHAQLSQHRIRGEWFEPHADVWVAFEACEFVAEEVA
jgi:hypothetical protein